MKVRDKALTPQIAYYATKAVVEAIANPEFGMEAISTDTLEKGTYNGTIWEWADFAGGAGTSIPIVTSDPGSPTDGELWLLRATVGGIANGVPIGLLLALTYTGNSGSTVPLQLSVWDDVVGSIIRY
jgi:hypothetical protein